MGPIGSKGSTPNRWSTSKARQVLHDEKALLQGSAFSVKAYTSSRPVDLLRWRVRHHPPSLSVGTELTVLSLNLSEGLTILVEQPEGTWSVPRKVRELSPLDIIYIYKFL
jgi:hypothetical protein